MINPLIISGAFLGWGLGANDSANIFGTAVYTKVIKYSTAVILIAVFVILGAVLKGQNGLHEISEYAFNSGVTTNKMAFLVMLSAAVTVAVMTVLKLPVSTSQAVVGAIIGCGVITGNADFRAGIKFFSAWVLTPVGGLVFAYILQFLTAKLLSERITSMKFYSLFIKLGYILAGIFGAYSLGANNVANVMGIFAGKLGLLSTNEALLYGGISIAIGAVTYSKPVMSTVGEGIIPLSQIEGFLVVIAAALTVYIYAIIGIPVSTSQAVIGAIIGIGLRVSVNLLDFRVLNKIFLAWIGTPTIAGIVCIITLLIFK